MVNLTGSTSVTKHFVSAAWPHQGVTLLFATWEKLQGRVKERGCSHPQTLLMKQQFKGQQHTTTNFSRLPPAARAER